MGASITRLILLLFLFSFPTEVTANVPCRLLLYLAQPFSWAYHAGSNEGRTVKYENGVEVREEVAWFGLHRRIIVRYPDGSVVNFNRTNRGKYQLIRDDFYPEDFFSPEKLKGLKVLDFGCGDGNLVNDLRYSGVDAHGLDIYITKKQREKNYFTMADGQKTGYPDNHFDVTFSTWSAFTYLTFQAYEKKIPGAKENAIAILKEMIRITKLGGKIRIAPVLHKRTLDGVEFPEIEQLISEHFPQLRISAKPDLKWLNRIHEASYTVGGASQTQLSSEVWIELEKVR